MHLSLDGVQEAKSSNNTIDAYSVQYVGCRNVYPIKLIKPYNRYKYNEQKMIQSVFTDINSTDIIIDEVICDNPKRAIMRNSLCHSAKFACEYCEAGAVSFINETVHQNGQETIETIQAQLQELDHQILHLSLEPDTNRRQVNLLNNMKKTLNEKIVTERKQLKKSNLVWPVSTMNGQPRTINKIRDITTILMTGRNSDAESEELTRDDRLGIVGPSILMTQPNFNMINNLPVEYMHSVCLGIVKRMLELTFKVGDDRQKISKCPLIPPKKFNDLIRDVRVPREFSRRCRQLNLSIMKAQELRNILLFLFPIVINCIGEEFVNDRKIWLLLVFMIRACVIPNAEYINVNSDHINNCCLEYYHLFQHLYGQKQCSYSVHVVSSHLLQIRRNQPLTFSSAFRFESFYAEMKNCFRAGTPSTLKQIMQNVVMKRRAEFHVCKKTIFLKPDKIIRENERKSQPKECNILIYTYENEEYLIYKILDISPTHVTCVRYGQYNVFFPETPNLSWKDIGVFRAGPLCHVKCHVPISSIVGKVIKVQKYLITCPSNVLREQ